MEPVIDGPCVQNTPKSRTRTKEKRARVRPPVHHVEIQVGNVGRLLLRQMEAVKNWRTEVSTYVKEHTDDIVRGRKMQIPTPPVTLIRRVADYIAYLAVARGGQDLGYSYYPFLYPLPRECWRPFVNGVSFVIRDDDLKPTRLVAVVSSWPAVPDKRYPITVSAQGSRWLLTYRGYRAKEE